MHIYIFSLNKMSSTYEILKNSPGFIGMASFTKTGLPIQGKLY